MIRKLKEQSGDVCYGREEIQTRRKQTITVHLQVQTLKNKSISSVFLSIDELSSRFIEVKSFWSTRRDKKSFKFLLGISWDDIREISKALCCCFISDWGCHLLPLLCLCALWWESGQFFDRIKLLSKVQWICHWGWKLSTWEKEIILISIYYFSNNFAFPVIVDVQSMVYIGFGFLMTFMKGFGYSAVSFNLLIASVSVQVGILTFGIARSFLNQEERIIVRLSWSE